MYIYLDDEDESSTEDDESNVEDIKLRIGDKVTASDKVATSAKETEAGAEISALVNYVQPVHFNSFESAESNYHLFVTRYILYLITNILTLIVRACVLSYRKKSNVRNVIVRRKTGDDAFKGETIGVC